MKTLLLTGITGFLGSHLAKILHSEYRLIGIKRTTSNLYRIKGFESKLCLHDIESNPLDQIFRENNIDAVIHMATDYGRANCYEEVKKTNIDLPALILKKAMQNRVETFINTDTFFCKKADYCHLKSYIKTKWQFCKLLSGINDKKTKIVNIRLEHIYGPKDRSEKFIPFIIRKLIDLNNSYIDLTDGKQKRDFVYISDVANAFHTILKNSDKIDFGFSNFEVGSGESNSIRNLVEMIKELSDSHVDLKFGALPHRNGEIMESKADIHFLKKLGWKARVNLKEGLERTIAYERKRKDVEK